MALLFLEPFLTVTLIDNCGRLEYTSLSAYQSPVSLCAPEHLLESAICSIWAGCVVTWPQPKSVPCGEACPSPHHVAVDHLVTSQHQRRRSRALGKGLDPLHLGTSGCG
jgi:hypothetical protein